jgi:hypothetical protein
MSYLCRRFDLFEHQAKRLIGFLIAGWVKGKLINHLIGRNSLLEEQTI